MEKRLLYIAPHRPGRSPGQRFRFEQFQPYLEKNGYKITYSYIINAWDDCVFYKKGNYLLKIFIGIKASFIRMRDLVRASKYDAILIYREAHFVGSTFFERLLAKRNKHLVFDFDDAIWLNDTSDANSNLKWLKKPAKTGSIISLCTTIIAGNAYLQQYALGFNRNVVLIPTVINTNYYQTKKIQSGNPICIGWTGSSTTIKHFELALPFLQILNQKYPQQLKFRVIVDIDYANPELEIERIPWNRNTEVEDLDLIDIGIMPLPDDDWSKGKCGFKGIQYMGLEKPTVMSPVGVNTEIINDGINGFLANSTDEWVEKLSLLIESEQLRKTIGAAGRKTIEEKYSLNSQKDRFLMTLNKL